MTKYEKYEAIKTLLKQKLPPKEYEQALRMIAEVGVEPKRSLRRTRPLFDKQSRTAMLCRHL